MKSFLRIIGINLLLLFGVVVLAELFFGNWVQTAFAWMQSRDGNWYFTDQYFSTVYANCPDQLTHHNYCPHVATREVLDPLDGGTAVFSYVDRSGLRVASPTEMDGRTDVAAADVINIGDSFMQARAVSFDETLSSEMRRRTGLNVLQVGFGSWAPVVEYGWLSQQKLKAGVQVNMFVGLNDVTPHYPQSTLHYHAMGQTQDNGTLKFGSFGLPVAPELRHFVAMHSAIYRGLLRLRLRLRGVDPGDAEDAALAQATPPFAGQIGMPGANLSDCSALSRHPNAVGNTLDHMELALDHACWSDATKREVEQAIQDIRAAAAFVAGFKGRLSVVLVTTPWAFSGETLPGKKTPRYNMTDEALIGTQGFASYLRQRLAADGISVADPEPLIRDRKAKDEQLYYFPMNGHWTSHAQSVLGEWMSSNKITLPPSFASSSP